MTKKISMSSLLSVLSADELQDLTCTHETRVLFNYENAELNADEAFFVQEQLIALGLEVVCGKSVMKGGKILEVYVPYGAELIA